MTRSHGGGRAGVAATPALLVALLVGSIAAPVPAAAGASFGPAPSTTVRLAGGIVPGRVDRSSLHLRATYVATLRLSYGARGFNVHSVATITNASGAPIDRVE